MTKFYKIANEGEDPKNDFELKNLGSKIKFNRLVNYGHGHIGTERDYRQTTTDDYDNSFVNLLCSIRPIHRLKDLLNFHLGYYEGDKNEFLAQIKYIIIPLMKKDKNNE